MAKCKTVEELGREVANEALDTFVLGGKTLREWIEQLKESRWISVKDRMPTDPRFVLVYVRHPAVSSFPAWSCIMTDMWLGDKWAENADEEVHEVTHWMPLPEPPKEES